MPIHFTDGQLDAIFRLAQPLQPHTRVTFLEILARKLGDVSAVGDGELYRTAREIIRENHLFEAPVGPNGHWGKYE